VYYRDDMPTRAEAEADAREWAYTECPDCGEIAVDPGGYCHACQDTPGRPQDADWIWRTPSAARERLHYIAGPASAGLGEYIPTDPVDDDDRPF